MPDFIQYIVCLDFRVTDYNTCRRCQNRFLVDVKFISGEDICKHCDKACEDNVYLCVPYRDNEKVKTLGARWDSQYKKWYVHKNNANLIIAIDNWKITYPSSVSAQPAQQRRLQFDKPDAFATASSDTQEAAAAAAVAAAAAAAAAKEAAAAPKAAVAAGDTAVAAEMQLSSAEENELRGFDLTQKWGACNGLSRAERWNRARKLGLEPPSRIFDLLQRVPSSSAAAQSLLSAYPL